MAFAFKILTLISYEILSSNFAGIACHYLEIIFQMMFVFFKSLQNNFND